MSNQGKIQIIGHIIFPYDSIISSVFLKERPAQMKTVSKNGKVISTEQISKELAKLLTEKGFDLKPCEKIHFEGRKKVFGVPMSISKNYQGKEIKELLITIKAQSAVELAKKQDSLISNISRFIPNLKYKSSIADKFVEC